MPPKIKIAEADIINKAMDIIREKGSESLNARELAGRLGCSVHPIFRSFSSMDGLKEAVSKQAEEIYNEQMIMAMEDKENGFLAMGLAYINFARQEKNLFKLLFMSENFKESTMFDIVDGSDGDDEIIAMLSQNTGLSTSASRELFAGSWLTTHGIAAMFATNTCRFSEEEIKRLLENSFMGLMMKLKREEEK